MAVMGRQGDVKEIKGLFLYLASDASSYQTGESSQGSNRSHAHVRATAGASGKRLVVSWTTRTAAEDAEGSSHALFGIYAATIRPFCPLNWLPPERWVKGW